MHSTARVVRSDWQENPQIRGRWMVVNGGKSLDPNSTCSPEHRMQSGLQLVTPHGMAHRAPEVPLSSSPSPWLAAEDFSAVPRPAWLKALWFAGVILSGCALFWFSA